MVERRIRRRRLGLLSVIAAFIGALAAVAPLAGGATGAGGAAKGGAPDAVQTAADGALAKLDGALQASVQRGAKGEVRISLSAKGDTRAIRSLMDRSYVGELPEGASFIVGTIKAGRLAKLAGIDGVRSVDLVRLERTGRPDGMSERGALIDDEARLAKLRARIDRLRATGTANNTVAAAAAATEDPRLDVELQDAAVHRFKAAWDKGYTGAGSRVAVLDGGTDFGHPDLVNTWSTGANGWPEAYDPFGALQWAIGLLTLPADEPLEVWPLDVVRGTSWYTRATTFTATPVAGETFATVSATVRTGPSRNFAAPSGSVAHTWKLPASWVANNAVVRLGGHPDDYLLAILGERAAYVVLDTDGDQKYETIYVDLDGDYDFADEKAVTQASPAAYTDLSGDGLADISGGLLTHISDGVSTVVPGGPDFFGAGVMDKDQFLAGNVVLIPPASGELVVWSGDYDPAIAGHGTLTASNVVGQGRAKGLAPSFTDLDPADWPGVVGGAPDAKLLPFGDIYFAFETSTQLGYILTNLAGVDATSNSYGDSAVDNDGFDASSQEADIINDLFGYGTTMLGSTGNGAPGYGTVSAPSPSSGISVGASTLQGSTGWDSIFETSQIVSNDVVVWSDRGPQATGATGVDLVANGARGPGDVTLNAVFDGNTAWETWGGTSRSTPVAAAATALVYQAHRAEHGTAPDSKTAKNILLSSAKDLGYDGWTQGAGSLDAGAAVDLTLGDDGATVTPNNWRAGDYHGTEYEVFPNLLAPGATDTQSFAVGGSGKWKIDDRQLKLSARETFSFTSKPLANQSPYNFNAPDYVIDITNRVKRHRNADLMVIRVNYPYAQFDADGDYVTDQDWRLLPYNWKDQDGDRKIYNDNDNDGVVDKVISTGPPQNPDGFAEIDYAASEIDEGEYVRFMYHRPGSNALTSFVRDPWERMEDGIFLGLQHSKRGVHDTTSFKIEITFYENSDWKWITTPSKVDGGSSFDARTSVPVFTKPGQYGGAITLSQGDHRIVVPVTVAVGAVAQQDANGKLLGSTTFGGANQAQRDSNQLYNNGAVFGAYDWSWRAESGDWRFFFLDVLKEPVPGTLFLANTSWDDAAPHTDVDTLLFGPGANTYQFFSGSTPFGAPYVLTEQGGSPNTNIGAGVWTFDTATGGNSDLVTAPVQKGLHEVVLHEVLHEGGKFLTPVGTTVGSANVNPSAVVQTTATGTGSFDVTFESSIALPGLVTEAFGLSQPVTTTETAQQDDQNDPYTASVVKPMTINHASTATITVALDQDIDLYIAQDANGDATLDPGDPIVAASATGAGDESVTMVRPDDGVYFVLVHGFGIAGTPTFPLTIDVVQGNDLVVTGPAGAIPAGVPVTVHVEYSNPALVAGQTYKGEIRLGPPSAPSALSIPVSVTRS